MIFIGKNGLLQNRQYKKNRASFLDWFRGPDTYVSEVNDGVWSTLHYSVYIRQLCKVKGLNILRMWQTRDIVATFCHLQFLLGFYHPLSISRIARGDIVTKAVDDRTNIIENGLESPSMIDCCAIPG
ncbi:MAG: hypothetical protein M3O30_06300 [Planctomycetota bacterium]|nr:hypothetical protein [Planctomycetota bacterium]